MEEPRLEAGAQPGAVELSRLGGGRQWGRSSGVGSGPGHLPCSTASFTLNELNLSDIGHAVPQCYQPCFIRLGAPCFGGQLREHLSVLALVSRSRALGESGWVKEHPRVWGRPALGRWCGWQRGWEGGEGSQGPPSCLCSQLVFKLPSLTSPASDRFSGVLACHQCLVVP